MKRSKRFSYLCVLIFVFCVTEEVCAESVFVVSGHNTGIVKAYSIDPNSAITWQADITNALPNATGLCLWPEKDRMFVTHEDDGDISWASIKNLDRDPANDDYATGITGGSGLGGMAVDEANSRLYVIARGTNHLYAFDYDEAGNTLIPISLSDTTTYRTLPDVGSTSGIDIAIDPSGTVMGSLSVARLYVSDNSKDVEYYNSGTWSHEGTITFEQDVIGIGIDVSNQYLYGGNFSGNSGHSYLMRMPLDGDPNDYIEKNMEASVMDISVDEETGYLYLTSNLLYNGRNGVVEVYDPTNWTDPNTLILIDRENDPNYGGYNNSPAGIAVGPTYKPENNMYLDKVDDVEDPYGYVEPGDIYHYDITFRPGPADEPNVVITDYLPEGVDFVSADPNWGQYFPHSDHKYVWELGYVDGYDPNTWTGGDPNYYFELTVQVNTYAEPAGVLYNKVTAESEVSYVDANEITYVDYWGGNIIYVDKYAPGPNIGTTWETAYKLLSDGLERAGLAPDPNVVEVRIADGTYKPGNYAGDSFEVPDGVSVYGGYPGYGASDPNDRDWKRYKTVLSGFISDTSRNNTVVDMGDSSLLDGVTVEEGERGADGSDTSSSVENCIIKENGEAGIYCENGNLNIQWCEIKENGEQGIFHLGNSYLLTMENCQVHGNLYDGIRTVYSTLTTLNSLIYQNGSGTTYYGINILNPSSSPDIHNNTIVDNINEGIRFVGSNTPDVRNNILYYNNPEETNSPQAAGIGTTYYCCIYDPNSQSSTPDGNGNITCEPDFVYDYEPYGYYHIKYESDCRNAGDNSVYNTGDVDMDNTERKEETTIDIGADEVACEDTWDPNDWTYDGVINLQEFSIFSAAWLSHDPNEYTGSDPNETINWDQRCDLVADYVIDLADLEMFCNNWLWQACWREDYVEVMYSMFGGGGESMMMAAPPLAAILSVYESQPAPEKSIDEQIPDLKEIIEFLEKIWLEDPYIQKEIDPDDWKLFMDAVYEGVIELKIIDVEIKQ